MSNIQKFYSQAQAADFARVFQFKVNKFGNVSFGEGDLVYVETTNLPGRTINNIQVPYMGLQFNVPGSASYPGSAGYNVTFRCDQAYRIRDLLEKNTFNTFSDSSSTGTYATPAVGNDLILQLLDKQNKTIREYTLFGCYVQSLADQTYDVKDNGTIVQVQATLAYQFWRITKNLTGSAGYQQKIGTPGLFGPNP